MTQGAGQGPDFRGGGFAAYGGGLPPAPPVPPSGPHPAGAGARPANPAAQPLSQPPVRWPTRSSGPAPAVTPLPDLVHAPALFPPTGPQAAAAASGTPPVPPVAPDTPESPGSATGAAAETLPDGYTPTRRDIPVVQEGAATTGGEPTLVDARAAATTNEGEGPLYVVGDVHGFLDQLLTALFAEGIIDAEGHWDAGNTRIWFLGDFTDRGPDGIGVIDLVMQLSAEAAAAGGYCKALMGNHELLLLGAKRFGDTPVNSGAGTASFQAAWLLNGGQRSDMERLEDHHLQWMSRLDAIALADEHLLVHSDATCYLDYGSTIEAVNDAVTVTLQHNDADETWDLFRKFTKRFAFREDESGPAAVRELLRTFGGERIVHGHSPIPYLLGEVGSEDDGEFAPPEVTGPHLYADGLALAMDGGVTMAGKLLVTRIPLTE